MESKETIKKCRVCLANKHLSQMKKRNDRSSGVATICKSCASEQEFFRVHNIKRPKDLSSVFKLIAGVKHKRCPTCFEYKTYDNFCKGNNQNTEGVGTYCSVCAKERKRQYRLKNGEHVRQVARDWVKNNYEKNKLQDKLRGERYRNLGKHKIARERHRKNNPEKIELQKQKDRLRSKLAVVNISESYVRSTLGEKSPMKGSEFSQEFVEAYQELMKLRRLIRESKI